MRLVLLCGLALAFVTPYPIQLSAVTPNAAKTPKDAPPPEKLEGTWVAVSGESGGSKFGKEDLGGLKLTFTNKTVRWEQKGSDAVESTFKLNPTKSPNQIDLGPTAPVGKKPAAGPGRVGIYKVEGNKLYLHLAMSDARPKDFSSRAGVISTVYVLERLDKTPKEK